MMMKQTFKKRMLSCLLAGALLIGTLAGCGGGGNTSTADNGSTAPATTNENGGQQQAADNASGESSLKGQRVRVVIGSTSTSGDSYMIAELVTRYLSAEMGFNGKVDAIGNDRALDEITKAKGDGSTIMMFHDMAYLSVLFGAVSENYALDNLTVGPRIGQNPGSCFGAKFDAPYNNLVEMTEWLSQNPDETVRVNIEAGSVSHIGFVAFYVWAQQNYPADVVDRIRVIVGGSTAEKLQVLWDGNADVIFADYSSLIQYTEDGVEDQLRMKIFDVMDSLDGIDIPTMADNGVAIDGDPFIFSKDFAMYLPKDMDAGVLAELDAAMQRVTENPDFQAEMAALTYKALPADQVPSTVAKDFIYGKRDLCEKIIAIAPDLDDIT